jgi:hypothetical protein
MAITQFSWIPKLGALVAGLFGTFHVPRIKAATYPVAPASGAAAPGFETRQVRRITRPAPLAAQWQQRRQNTQQLEAADRFFQKWVQPASLGAIGLTLALLLSFSFLVFKIKPIPIDESSAPIQAIKAVQAQGLRGPVLNEYSWGGHLIYADIAPFIDGRADMYRDVFFKAYLEALTLKESDGLEKLLDRYKIEWTLLPPGSPAVTLLDHLPEWRRFYADKTAVVHVRADTTHE